MGVSKNSGTPKSSILIGFPIIFTIHFGGKIALFLVQHPHTQLTLHLGDNITAACQASRLQAEMAHWAGHRMSQPNWVEQFDVAIWKNTSKPCTLKLTWSGASESFPWKQVECHRHFSATGNCCKLEPIAVFHGFSWKKWLFSMPQGETWQEIDSNTIVVTWLAGFFAPPWFYSNLCIWPMPASNFGYDQSQYHRSPFSLCRTGHESIGEFNDYCWKDLNLVSSHRKTLTQHEGSWISQGTLAWLCWNYIYQCQCQQKHKVFRMSHHLYHHLSFTVAALNTISKCDAGSAASTSVAWVPGSFPCVESTSRCCPGARAQAWHRSKPEKWRACTMDRPPKISAGCHSHCDTSNVHFAFIKGVTITKIWGGGYNWDANINLHLFEK